VDTIETLHERNRRFAAGEFKGGLAMAPRLRAMVIGCADPRVDPANVLGLELGDEFGRRPLGEHELRDEVRMHGGELLYGRLAELQVSGDIHHADDQRCFRLGKCLRDGRSRRHRRGKPQRHDARHGTAPSCQKVVSAHAHCVSSMVCFCTGRRCDTVTQTAHFGTSSRVGAVATPGARRNHSTPRSPCPTTPGTPAAAGRPNSYALWRVRVRDGMTNAGGCGGSGFETGQESRRGARPLDGI